jgi:threonyl-tRNA synthetase
VAIHRAILGSFERFIGILIEHFAGAFPTWLAPVQARVLPASAKHAAYASAVHRRLLDAGVRAELDDRSEKLGYKVREAQVQKVPYVLVMGEREAREGTASVRKRGGEDVGAMLVDRFLAEVTGEIRTRAVTSRIGPERG